MHVLHTGVLAALYMFDFYTLCPKIVPELVLKASVFIPNVPNWDSQYVQQVDQDNFTPAAWSIVAGIQRRRVNTLFHFIGFFIKQRGRDRKYKENINCIKPKTGFFLG